MKVQYIGIEKIKGPLVFLRTQKEMQFQEQIRFILENGEIRLGRIISMNKDICAVEVYEGTQNMNLRGAKIELQGTPLQIKVSKEMLGRTFDGIGRPIDGLGQIPKGFYKDINTEPINPVAREYPRDYIQTGISGIDGLVTLIQGQKLPIFSGSGLPHHELAKQIIKYTTIGKEKNFAIVLGLIGVEFEVAQSFQTSLQEDGIGDKVVVFQNLASDPSIERILTPRSALTCAEYLAFEEEMHVLVILTDMTNYAESLREISSLKGEIPSRKGYPGYLYSDLASLYERAGKIKGNKGSLTQIPILTMPNDDISHPVVDVTGYITEGQIVLSRELAIQGINPPISILNSLSRLMKDGIGEWFTSKDHGSLADAIFSSYAKVQDVRALAQVLGEEELSIQDKQYLEFGKKLEEELINQPKGQARTMERTLEIMRKVLKILPKS